MKHVCRHLEWLKLWLLQSFVHTHMCVHVYTRTHADTDAGRGRGTGTDTGTDTGTGTDTHARTYVRTVDHLRCGCIVVARHWTAQRAAASDRFDTAESPDFLCQQSRHCNMLWAVSGRRPRGCKNAATCNTRIRGVQHRVVLRNWWK